MTRAWRYGRRRFPWRSWVAVGSTKDILAALYQQCQQSADNEEVHESLLQGVAASAKLCEGFSDAPPERVGMGHGRVIEQRGRPMRGRAGIQAGEAARLRARVAVSCRARCGHPALDHGLGPEVRLEELVELLVVETGEVDGFLRLPILAVNGQFRVVVEDPL
eukprot:CAMPEP_0119070878 /NCGR_PEP_ID=MMETSP1178-20130426/44353_1 /TAXON_ID=33656 /ORGANISM="unid sp, Strain CCMP2000" /LENGTH=162 /DNA_ID=CAMNT_0007052755 /DNA_START=67 /DNA_END=557 /DNA_ORIENTATION=-